MSLDGFLAVLAVLIGLYALAQPVQRKSLWLFFPKKLFFALISVSAFLLIWKIGMDTYGYVSLYKTCDFLLMTLPFLIPIGTLLIVLFRWNEGKITDKNQNGFINFIHLSRNENQYDELIRILAKNEDVESFSDDLIISLFEQEIIRHINYYPDWASLSLVSRINDLNKRKYVGFVVENLIRDLMEKKNSVITKFVAACYGGLENQLFTEYEYGLVEKTIGDPQWYIDVRADYDLLFTAIEKIDSGVLDKSYNSNENVYIQDQGRSTRTHCPVYLFIQMHSMMIERAIENNMLECDYYVTDLSDIFRHIVQHFQYNESVWSSPCANYESPTPYLYLLKRILNNINRLVEKGYEKTEGKLNSITERLLLVWVMCIKQLIDFEQELPPDFILYSLRYYFDFTLKVISKTEKEEFESKWSDTLLRELRYWTRESLKIRNIVKETLDRMDIGKRYIFDNRDYLKEILLGNDR